MTPFDLAVGRPIIVSMIRLISTSRILAVAVIGCLGIAFAHAQDAAAPEPTPQTAAPEKPESRIDRLFEQLAKAESEKGARIIAERIAKAWLASGSDTVDLLMRRALLATHAKDYALALDLLDAVVRLKPDYAEGWNKRATVHYLRKDYSRSLGDIHETLRLEPRHFGAILGLAVILDQLDNDARALAAYRRLLEIYPHNEDAEKAVEKLQPEAEGREI